jgi:predicted DNA binding CopG/RHH family protein
MRRRKTKAVPVDTPEFRSEAEEAEWWDRHQNLISDLLLKHGRRGAVPTRNVSIRLPLTDLERARTLAEQRGIGYQTVIKSLLHEALRKEFKSAPKQSGKSRD